MDIEIKFDRWEGEYITIDGRDYFLSPTSLDGEIDDENVPTEVGSTVGDSLPLYPPVECPDQSESARPGSAGR